MKPLDNRTTDAMSKVRQAKTKPEETVAKALREIGASYRRNVRALPGTPDFANQSNGWVVQVHGCFWHQHDCKRGTMPSHNQAEWRAKFERNKARDAEAERALSSLGLRVLTVWECETKTPSELKERLKTHLG
ncbi:very short patch repair endonuclease [Brevundimonas sp. M20]|uniref:very short patch repair endonuclease n=1 Tax=Brevundimonas sp. M20 TaxID=2591463 RepID=UPI001147A41D|nr:very short patch repair endonuclease [Brevundimonas sp. M20]QDH74375.1 very short patch repair endonuclease [Brevundimonas sp. M20]